MSAQSSEGTLAHYDLLRLIATDAVAATEQWARIVRRTTFKAPDPQSKLAYALDHFDTATHHFGITVPPRIKELVIESAVDQRSDKGFAGFASFGMFEGPPPDGPDKD